MPQTNYTCIKCGRAQDRHHNARKCLDCQGHLIPSNTTGVSLILKAQAIEAQARVLARERDVFRQLLSEWQEILDSWDEAIDELDEVRRGLESVVDKLSEQI